MKLEDIAYSVDNQVMKATDQAIGTWNYVTGWSKGALCVTTHVTSTSLVFYDHISEGNTPVIVPGAMTICFTPFFYSITRQKDRNAISDTVNPRQAIANRGFKAIGYSAFGMGLVDSLFVATTQKVDLETLSDPVGFCLMGLTYFILATDTHFPNKRNMVKRFTDYMSTLKPKLVNASYNIGSAAMGFA